MSSHSKPKGAEGKSLKERLEQVAHRQGQSRIRVVHPKAAGIDVASEVHYVAVPEDRAKESVREFGTYTEDLHALARWLKECGVDTVAVESTGVYWVPLFQVLDQYEIDAHLVHANYTSNVPGKKSDVLDCQWLRELHRHGLLPRAFRPAQDICTLRTLWRHRARLIEDCTTHVQRMQKAMTEMNILVHHAVTDITGQTGMAIIRDIVAGTRDPIALAKHRDPRCKKSEEEIAKALTGDYNRTEHLFLLKQELEHYDFIQRQIEQLDEEIRSEISKHEKKTLPDQQPPPTKPRKKKRSANAPKFELAQELHQLIGVDLVTVDGLEVLTLMTVYSECGADMTSWPTEDHFTSWLGSAPGCKKSGGKSLSGKTRKVKNRAALAFRLAAQSLENSKSYLGAFYRRIKRRKGPQKAITAAARRLAIIYYRACRFGEDYIERGEDYYDQKYREKALKALHKQAAKFGYQLVPVNPQDATALDPDRGVPGILQSHFERTAKADTPSHSCGLTTTETTTRSVPEG